MRNLQRNIRAESQGVFNATGNLIVSVPCPVGPSWEIKQIAVSTNITTVNPTCTTYIGTNASGVVISTSLTGNGDTDSQPNVTLRPGDSLAAVWGSGVVGAIGKLTFIYDEVAY